MQTSMHFHCILTDYLYQWDLKIIKHNNGLMEINMDMNMDYDHDHDCFIFGALCKEEGLDYSEFLAAFNNAYYHTQYAIDSAKAGYNSK